MKYPKQHLAQKDGDDEAPGLPPQTYIDGELGDRDGRLVGFGGAPLADFEPDEVAQ